jgi:hypothetical protein
MALTKNWNKNVFGKDVVFNNVYIKVGTIAGSKKILTAIVDILVFEDGESIDKLSYIVPHNMSGKNSIAQVYEYIKMAPEFIDAKDC